MMKNNVVFLFVDSVSWSCVGNNRVKVSPTPFLDSLRSESLVTTNLYSHAPYTDAATHSLFTGRNCLDDFGYFFKVNTSPVNHYKLFYDQGYETYDFNYPFYIIGDEENKSIDHSYYVSSFVFGSEWGGIYNYYSEIIRERDLHDYEYALLIKRTQYMFEAWTRYLDDVVYHPETLIIHKKILETYDAKTSYESLLNEQKRFEEHPREYIQDLLQQGRNSILFGIDTSSVASYIDADFLDNFVCKKYASLFRKIKRNNFKANIFRNFPSLKRLLWGIKQFIQTKNSDELLFILNFVGSLSPMSLMQKRWRTKMWQTNHPAGTVYKAAIEVLKNRTESEKPFYLYCNVEEPHNNLAFFSYDTQDKNILDEEMEMLEDYVDKLGTDFVGNLIYLLSLRYTDYYIEKFCNSLKEMGLWDNTTLMVVADHGSSYTFFPIHNKRVNCFDDECYHIPMLIRHPGFEGRVVNSYQYSKDVLPTLLEMVGLNGSSYFKGKSMITTPNKEQFVITEYMGPGCPDLTSRRMWLSVRDMNYIVAYKVGIYEEFEEGDLAEVYDLSKDPYGYFNLNREIDREKINYLLCHLKQRYEEIKKDVNAFVQSL